MKFELIAGPCDGEIIEADGNVHMAVKVHLGQNHAYFVEEVEEEDEVLELENTFHFDRTHYWTEEPLQTMIHIGHWTDLGEFVIYKTKNDNEN